MLKLKFKGEDNDSQPLAVCLDYGTDDTLCWNSNGLPLLCFYLITIISANTGITGHFFTLSASYHIILYSKIPSSNKMFN